MEHDRDDVFGLFEKAKISRLIELLERAELNLECIQMYEGYVDSHYDCEGCETKDAIKRFRETGRIEGEST